VPPKTPATGVALGRKLTEQEIDLIRRTQLPEGCGQNELELLVHFAEHTGLDPLLRQVWLSKKGAVQCTIDGFRVVAGRSGEYEGQTKPEWCGADGVWRDVWTEKTPPVAARVGVYRKGFKEPMYAPARYEEYMVMYNGGPNTMWRKMPANQLAKCAEALSLRKAFPEYLSGVYTADEMAQAEIEPAAADEASNDPAPVPEGTQSAPAGADEAGGKSDASGTGGAGSVTSPVPVPRAHTTVDNQVSQILDPVRDTAKKLNVAPSQLGAIFKDRYGHTTKDASVDEALEFAGLALTAPTDDGARFVEYLRTAPASQAA
jgi:phage recombination protein Bet